MADMISARGTSCSSSGLIPLHQHVPHSWICSAASSTHPTSLSAQSSSHPGCSNVHLSVSSQKVGHPFSSIGLGRSLLLNFFINASNDFQIIIFVVLTG